MKAIWKVAKVILLCVLILLIIPVFVIGGALVWHECEAAIVQGPWEQNLEKYAKKEYDFEWMLGKSQTDIEEEYGAFQRYMPQYETDDLKSVLSSDVDTYWAVYRIEQEFFNGIFYDEYPYFCVLFEKGRATGFAIAVYKFTDPTDLKIIEMITES